jgi:hypothetical protein
MQKYGPNVLCIFHRQCHMKLKLRTRNIAGAMYTLGWISTIYISHIAGQWLIVDCLAYRSNYAMYITGRKQVHQYIKIYRNEWVIEQLGHMTLDWHGKGTESWVGATHRAICSDYKQKLSLTFRERGTL